MNILRKAAVQGATCGLLIGIVLLVGGRLWRPATVAAEDAAVTDVVRVRRFELLDENGKMRAMLGMLPAGPGFALYDPAGEMRASLRMVLDKWPSLALSDSAGKIRAVLNLSLFSDESPALTFYDSAGKMRAQLEGLSYPGPRLILLDEDRKKRAVLGTNSLRVIKTGVIENLPESSIVLLDEDERVLWSAP